MKGRSATPITAAQARQIAAKVAAHHLEDLIENESISLLQDSHLEAENCWMFFRNKAIFLPSERALSDFAYCVSRKGHARSIPDFSSDSSKVQAYLEMMSDHFKERGLHAPLSAQHGVQWLQRQRRRQLRRTWKNL